MTASASAVASTSSASNPAFWDRLWRLNSVNFVVFFVIMYVLYGTQPPMGASADAIGGFYGGNRMRILLTTVFSQGNVLNLLWFAIALQTTLADANRKGWGAAATVSSSVLAGLLLLLTTITAALAYSIAGTGNAAVTSSLNDLIWVLVVLTSFPRAMLIMSGSFGLWRAGLVSKGVFVAGVTAMMLTLAAGTTWMADGFWAPDGAYSRTIAPLVGLVWLLVFGRALQSSPNTRAAW